MSRDPALGAIRGRGLRVGRVVVNQLYDFTKEVDLRRVMTCSWCHEPNVVTPGPVCCKKCGHRAGLPRLGCDCRRCLALKIDSSPGRTGGEIG
jgi:hypothetical protein